MRVALTLGGTDLGRSGIGVYVRELLPRLHRLLADRDDELVVLGTREERAEYRDALDDVRSASTYGSHPAASALFYLGFAGVAAARLGADVLLLPAGNRRTTLVSPLPTVSVVHDLAQLHVRGKYDRLRMAYLRHVVVRALASADRLVAVSEATADDVRDALGRRAPPVDVVLNGVDHERFAPRTSEDLGVRDARARYELRNPYLLYPSRLEHPGKNHLQLLRGFAESGVRKTHDLVLAGKDWGARERIESLAADLGLAERVHLLGFVPDEVLPPLVAGADAAVMVGLREGFGLPALESLAAGKPVCAADAGALPEVVGELGALCDPHDPASIAAALDRVIEDEALRREVAERGPLRAAGRSWGRTAEGLVVACERALGR